MVHGTLACPWDTGPGPCKSIGVIVVHGFAAETVRVIRLVCFVTLCVHPPSYVLTFECLRLSTQSSISSRVCFPELNVSRGHPGTQVRSQPGKIPTCQQVTSRSQSSILGFFLPVPTQLLEDWRAGTLRGALGQGSCASKRGRAAGAHSTPAQG